MIAQINDLKPPFKLMLWRNLVFFKMPEILCIFWTVLAKVQKSGQIQNFCTHWEP